MKEDKAYIAICKCGGILAACATDHPEDAAEMISSLIKDGFEVQTVDGEYVRKNAWCKNHGNCKEAPCNS